MMTPLEIALGEYGNHSIKGIFNNAQVVKYFQEIGQKWVTNDDTAWCAAFTNWCLVKARKMQTGSLAARSFLTYGAPTSTPKLGDIVVLWRIDKSGPYGHVGFFISKTKDKVYILGGNQNDEVDITAFDISRVLSYRQVPLTQ